MLAMLKAPLVVMDFMRYGKGASFFFMNSACALTPLGVLSIACFVSMVFKVAESIGSCFSDFLVMALLTMARLDNVAGRDGSWGITAIVRGFGKEVGATQTHGILNPA